MGKREILFRGKLSKNGAWVYGMPTYDFKYIFNSVQIDSCDNYEVIPESVGQYTGLTDKNGTKIFEGDIVFNETKTLLTCKDDPRLYIIEWQNGKYGTNLGSDIVWLKEKLSFIFKKINPIGKNYMNLIFNQNQIEIVGNIHDNPELLNK